MSSQNWKGDISTAFNNGDWIPVQCPNQPKILVHSYNTKAQIMEYDLTMAPDELEEVEEIMRKRVRHPFWVNVIHFEVVNRSVCYALLYTEKIQSTFTEFGRENFPDLAHLHILAQVLIGFQRLVRCFGFFIVTSDCIGLNSKQVVKVWHNSNFASPYPLKPVSFEEDMVASLLHSISVLMDMHTCRTHPISFRQFLYKSRTSLCLSAIKTKFFQFVNQYHQGIIPKSLNPIINYKQNIIFGHFYAKSPKQTSQTISLSSSLSQQLPHLKINPISFGHPSSTSNSNTQPRASLNLRLSMASSSKQAQKLEDHQHQANALKNLNEHVFSFRSTGDGPWMSSSPYSQQYDSETSGNITQQRDKYEESSLFWKEFTLPKDMDITQQYSEKVKDGFYVENMNQKQQNTTARPVNFYDIRESQSVYTSLKNCHSNFSTDRHLESVEVKSRITSDYNICDGEQGLIINKHSQSPHDFNPLYLMARLKIIQIQNSALHPFHTQGTQQGSGQKQGQEGTHIRNNSELINNSAPLHMQKTHQRHISELLGHDNLQKSMKDCFAKDMCQKGKSKEKKDKDNDWEKGKPKERGSHKERESPKLKDRNARERRKSQCRRLEDSWRPSYFGGVVGDSVYQY